MREDYRKSIAAMVGYTRRGLYSPSEAARWILSYSVEALRIAEYIESLPTELRHEIIELLPAFPTTEEGWVVFDKLALLDGNEYSWARMVVVARANTEAARAYFFGEASPAQSADFEERVRAARLAYLEGFMRNGYKQPDGDEEDS